jgi:hypothetical protein
VARRIQLPSSSELFDDPAPRPGRVAAETAPSAQQAAAPARPRGSRAKATDDRPAPRHRSPRSSPALKRRMSQVEGMLCDLPIESLIDLRDGLEGLLTADAINEKELAALLALGR